MTRIIELTDFGDADRLTLIDRDLAPPGPGQLRIRHQAIGVNFIDIYHRRGLYPLPLPTVPGVEGAGVVEAIGDDVEGFAPGDRVAYAGAPLGAYAEVRNLPAARALKLPDAIDADIAAGGLLRGLTVQMLLRGPRPVAAGSTILIHAAAGGLGQLLTRWARALDIRVIGTVSSDAKAEIARAAGAETVIVGRDADFAARAMNLTDGRGVDVVYDGLGGDYLRRSFDAVAEFGTVASVGQAAGPPSPVTVTDMARRGLALWRPSVMLYVSDTARYRIAAAELLDMLATGRLPVEIGAAYTLEEASRAHSDLETGATTGSVLLRP